MGRAPACRHRARAPGRTDLDARARQGGAQARLGVRLLRGARRRDRRRETSLAKELEPQVRLVRKLTGQRVAVGFGISTPEQVNRVARFADGVVVGSAIVDRIAEIGDRPSLTAEIESFAHSLALATRRK